MKGLEGKVAVVTGGSSGIGLAVVHAFATAGTKVVISDIQDGTEIARGIKESGGDAIFVRADPVRHLGSRGRV